MESDHNLASALTSGPISIGKWTFYADQLNLECDDKNIKLEPRVAYLLYYLAKNAGTPVSRGHLMEHVWSGMVVGDEALTGAINKLRGAFGDDSHHPEVIKTIPKVGYQLIADVQFSTSEKPISKKGFSSRNQIAIISFATIGLLIVASTYFLLKPTEINQETKSAEQTLNPTAERHSIAVLPFTNMGNDAEQEYFVDGITEDLITDLSKLSGLLVIARNSISTYKNKAPDVQQVAEKLGVIYVLQGSVRRAGDQLRINVQLINAETGEHLWTERYDRLLQGIFVIQDEITTSIVEALKIQLGTQETDALLARSTVNFEAYDLFLRGQRAFSSRTRENLSEAISLYRKAVELDPGFSRAYGAIAVAMTFQYRRGFTDTPLETMNLAFELAQNAAAMNSNIPQVYWSLGYVHLFRKEYNKAVHAVQNSIQISPNYADAFGLLALIYNSQGNSIGAIESITKGMKLNPYYSYDYPYNLGRAQYLAGRYEEAIVNLNKALEKNETVPTPRIYLIASYVKAGMIDDAEWEVEQIQVHNPEMTISQLRRTSPQKDTLMDELALNLREAGLSE